MSREQQELQLVEAYERGEGEGPQKAWYGALWRGDWERENALVLAEEERRRG